MQSRKHEFAELGETALRQLRGPVLTRVRKKIAQWRDPRARLLRRRRRSKQTAVAGATATGTLGAGSVVSFSPSLIGFQADPALAAMLDVGGFGLAVTAVASGAGTIAGTVKHRRLMRTPLPAPAPEPVELPARDSSAYEPMRRLRDAERSLHEVLAKLSATGAGTDAASDARTTADGVSLALREVAAKVSAVESAIPHAPEDQQAVLRDDVARLREELDEGVDGYGGLVAAAGRAVAAGSAPEQKHLMQDATDRLMGLSDALQELSRSQSPGWDTPQIPRSGGNDPASGDRV